MDATYRLKPYELNIDFFETLKRTFKDKEIVVSVEEIQDETDRLLSTEASRKYFSEALEAVKRGVPYRTMTMEELDAMVEG
jgi:phospholipid N-methyltransferase